MVNKLVVSDHDFDTKDIGVVVEGTKLKISFGGSTKEADLSTILPEPKSQYKISDKSKFNKNTKNLELVTYADGLPDLTTYISLADILTLIPTVEGAKGAKGDKGDKGDTGLAGANGRDGKSAYEVWKEAGNTGSVQDFLNSLKGRDGTSSSFDLSNLPKVAWKKGTEILVKQDGNLKLMKANESLFQEIGVGITANKTVGDIGDKYHLVVTVTNTGEDTNEMTLLDIIKPQLGNYTMSNFTNRASAGASVEKVTDTHYKIKKLAKGGTAIVEFDVTPNASGTFQFGASVNPNTALDMQSNNNQASIILSARVAVNPDITPSVDCPLIDITYNGKKLVGHSRGAYLEIGSDQPFNILASKNTLKDLSFSVSQDVTVVIQGNNKSYSKTSIMLSNNRAVGQYFGYVNIFVKASDSVNLNDSYNTVKFKYENNKITILSENDCIRISVRPKGNNCKWQHFDIYSSYDIEKPYTYTTSLPHIIKEVYSKDSSLTATKDATIKANINILDSSSVTVSNVVVGGNNEVTKKEILSIQLPHNKVTNGDITVSNTTFSALNTKGNLAIHADRNSNRMTVSTTASITSADNLVANNIKFEVV